VQEELERCYAAALRILAYRFNSAAELRRKLRRKEFEDETIAATLSRLQADKWLDDERFAGALVRSRARKRVGRLRIRRELQEAGVAEDAAARAIEENLDPEQERDELVVLGRKKIEALRRRHGDDYLSTEVARAKVASSLVRSGYETSMVLDVVAALMR
jgi:regulatory protein